MWYNDITIKRGDKHHDRYQSEPLRPRYQLQARRPQRMGCLRICRNYPHKAHSAAYDKDSDVNFGTRHISVKSSGFSLMAGSLCEGLTEFDAIWNLYETKAHSNEWCYVTADFTGYFMNREEFKSFVYSFCTTEKESAKNGGAVKIRCRKETAKMLRWLEERA